MQQIFKLSYCFACMNDPKRYFDAAIHWFWGRPLRCLTCNAYNPTSVGFRRLYVYPCSAAYCHDGASLEKCSKEFTENRPSEGPIAARTASVD